MSKPDSNPFAFTGPITLDNLDQLFSHHRQITGGWSMEETGGAGGSGGEGGQGAGEGGNGQNGDGGDPKGGDPKGAEGYKPPATQAELDRIISDRVQRERAKFPDYDVLKEKAGKATTLEERLAAVEAGAAKDKADATRARIAAEFGITTKPAKEGEKSDADLFLTGEDETTLRAQAERLAGRQAETRRRNHVGGEGQPLKGGAENPMREFARGLFGRTS